MPARTPRVTPVRADDIAVLRVLEAAIETLKAENEILRRRARRRRDAGGAGGDHGANSTRRRPRTRGLGGDSWSDRETLLDLVVVAAFWLAPFVVLFFLLRKEARETRAALVAMERRLQDSFERLTGEFAELQVKHFGLFRVKPRPGRMSDSHWQVAEIDNSDQQQSDSPPE